MDWAETACAADDDDVADYFADEDNVAALEYDHVAYDDDDNDEEEQKEAIEDKSMYAWCSLCFNP